MIHIDDGGPLPKNRQFIVAENVPNGWSGETITADLFAKTMNARIMKPMTKGKHVTTALMSNTTPTQRVGGTLSASMGCCGGMINVTK